MKKGYTVEVIDRQNRKSELFHFTDEKSARNAMIGKGFCILTEWAQFEDGFGNYEIEIARAE